jgi:hypothetical protein
MKETSRNGPRGAALAALALGLTAAACAPKAARRQTDVMEKTRALSASVTAAVLRARVDDLAERLVGRIEAASDRIRAEADDPAVRRRALTAKIDAMPAIYSAAYRADPLVALVDVWALAFQMQQFVEEGEGREAYGPQQPLVRALAHDVLADVDAVAQRITTGPDAYARARGDVEGWARRNPVERSFASRASMAAYMAERRSERDAFVAVGAVSETLDSLSQRLNTYAAQLPKQARWEAELLIADAEHEPVVAGVLGDVHALGATARAANLLLGDVPGLVEGEASPIRRMLAAERRSVLVGVNTQRLETLEYVTGERVAVVAAVREERIALVAALRQERIETLAEVDAIKSRAIESGVAGLRGLVDYALFRVAALLLFLILAAAVAAVGAYSLTIGRRRTENGRAR